MCRAVEEYAEERERKATEETKVDFVDELLKDGCTLEKALKLAKLDEETYNKYKIA